MAKIYSVILGVLLPLALWGADFWETPPEIVSEETGIAQLAPKIVTDPQGNGHALWSSNGTTLFYSYRSHDDTEWSDPLTVASGSTWTSYQIVIDVANYPNVPTAYVAFLGDNSLSAASIPSPYNALVGPTPIMADYVASFNLIYNGWRNMGRPQPGAIVVMEYSNPSASGVAYSTSTGADWSTAQPVVIGATSVEHLNPQVVTNSKDETHGNAYVMWIEGSSGSYTPYFAYTEYTADWGSISWGMPVALSMSTHADPGISPSATTPINRSSLYTNIAFGSWVENPTAGVYNVFCIGLPYPLSGPATQVASFSSGPTIQLTGDFTTFGLLAWLSSESSISTYLSTDNNSSWSLWTSISGVAIASPSLTFDQRSNAIVIWEDLGTIYAKTCLSGQSWSPPLTVSNAGRSYEAGSPSVSGFGFVEDQQGLAGWSSLSEGVFSIQSAFLNYVFPAPPSSSSNRSFHRPSNRRH